jgi:hypothetical protein
MRHFLYTAILSVEAFLAPAVPHCSLFQTTATATRCTTTSQSTATNTRTRTFLQTIVSPFDESNTDSNAATKATTTTTTAPSSKTAGPLDLTWENVEMVLDEMRPFLIQDGGNVAIKEIDGPVVRLELQVCVLAFCKRLYISCDVYIPSMCYGQSASFLSSSVILSTLTHYVYFFHNLQSLYIGSMRYMSIINTNNENGFGAWFA